jgi:FG-GAP-like repeat
MRFHEPLQAPSGAASPYKDSRSQAPGRARTRRSVALAGVLALLGGLEARTAHAQGCTTPSFITPSGSRIISTPNVVQPGHLAVGDLNRDGRLDFVVTDLQNPILEVFLQTPLPLPPGTWTSIGSYSTVGVATSVKVADLNRDGIPDVLVSTNGTNQGRVFLGNGTGALAFATNLNTQTGSTTTTDLATVDIDRDGILDVVIADITPSPAANIGVYAFKGNGNGTFQASIKFDTPDYGSIAVGDFSDDGKDDLAVTEASNITPALVIYTGTSIFSPPFNPIFGIAVGNNPLTAGRTSPPRTSWPGPSRSS